MLRTLVAITDNEPGVLDRIASTFRRRSINIHSLTVSPTLDPDVSRLTIVLEQDDRGARLARNFLERLVNIHRVEDLTEASPLVRDTALLRVSAHPAQRPGIFQIAHLFQADILDVGADTMILACSGSLERVEAFMEALRPFGLLEMGRTGAVAMEPCAGKAALSLEPAVSF